MATLCVSYLNFDCFFRETSQQDLEKYSSNGSYAFQQYAVCNWIQHVQSLKNCWELLSNSDCTLVYNACRVLLQRDSPHRFCEIPPASRLAKPPYTALNKALCSLYDAYEEVCSISDNGVPLAMQHMHQVRMAVEHLFSTSTNPLTSRLLHDSYGPLLFKCPIVQCPSFQEGFATQTARDNHYKAHEPPFMCPEEGCDYAILGFLEEITLKTHLRLCHDPISSQITFPKVKSRSVEYALNDAIDRDDLTAINDLAKELSLIVDRKTGFLMRAIQKGSQQAAVLISTLLGTEAEFVHIAKGCTAFSEAAAKGYAEILKVLLNSCETLQVRDKRGQDALVIAALNGHEAVVRLLLDKGAKIEGKDNNEVTALHAAASRGHESVARLLLDEGAKIEGKDQDGGTALFKAAWYGHEAVVRLLLDKGAKIEEKDKDGGTALFMAASHRREAVVRLLLDRDADIMAEDNGGRTALHWAANNGHDTVVRLLLDKYGDTALLKAASHGDEAMVRLLLLDKGAKIEGKDKNGKTALHKAASHGHEEVVRLLLDRNADITADDKDGWTVLQWAVSEGYETVVRLLLDKGAEAEGKGKNGVTALLIAASRGHEEVVRLLLDRNADITVEDNYGWTALQWAAKYGHKTVVRLLLDKGAEAEAKDKN